MRRNVSDGERERGDGRAERRQQGKQLVRRFNKGHASGMEWYAVSGVYTAVPTAAAVTWISISSPG